MKRKLSLILLILTSASAIAFAQVPKREGAEVLDDFTGGLFTNAASHKIPKNYATAMRNVYIDDKIGAITKGNGWTSLGSNATVKFYRGIWDLTLEDGTIEFLLFGSTTDPANSSSGVLLKTQNFQTYSTVLTALDATLDLDSVQVQNKRWFTNGSSPTFTYDNTTVQVLDGTNNTPNVPRGQFIEYYQGRVWTFSTSSNTSQLSFSALTDTSDARIALPPDAATAWLATNTLYVDRGNGAKGTFLRVYDKQLRVGKENAMYTIYGTGASNFQWVKNRAITGFVSQKSVIELDNLLYGQARDGYYSFNGEDMRRLSDPIADQVQNVLSDINRIVSNGWDLKSDFQKGTLNNSTTTVDDLVEVNPTQYANTTNEETAPSGDLTILSSLSNNPSSSTAYINVIPTSPFSPVDLYTLTFAKIWASASVGCGIGVVMNVKNKNTGVVAIATVSVTNTVTALEQKDFRMVSPAVSFTGAELNGSSMAIQLVNPNGSICADTLSVSSPTALGNALLVLNPATTGQFVSEIATVSTPIRSWSAFLSSFKTKGGTINFFTKSGNSVSAVNSAAWNAINSGAVPSFPVTDTFVQWAASFTASDQTMPPLIGNVYVNHVANSGSDTRSFSIPWVGRWWLAVATESTGKYPLIYVKSRITNKTPDAWMQFDGIPAKQFLTLNNVLYAVSSTTGIVMRLDYGTNYNGSTITAYLITPDLTLGDNFSYKDLWEATLDADRSPGSSVLVGWSLDSRAYNYNTVSTNGTGRARYTIRNPNAGGATYCKQVKVLFGNASLDQGMTVNSFKILYRPTEIYQESQ